jgi:hypothetical protein
MDTRRETSRPDFYIIVMPKVAPIGPCDGQQAGTANIIVCTPTNIAHAHGGGHCVAAHAPLLFALINQPHRALEDTWVDQLS